jgi:excisionase family DNA binding protein
MRGKKPMTENLLTVREVSERLAVHRLTVAAWTRAGRLPGIRVGRQWRYRPADIEDFLNRNQQEANAEVMAT